MALKKFFKKMLMNIKNKKLDNLLFEVQLDIARKNNRNNFILCCEFYSNELKMAFEQETNIDDKYVYSAIASNKSRISKRALHNFLSHIFDEYESKLFIKIFSRERLTRLDVSYLCLSDYNFFDAFYDKKDSNDTRYCYSIIKKKYHFDYGVGSDICLGIINEALCLKVFNFKNDPLGILFECNVSDSEKIEKDFFMRGTLSLSSNCKPLKILKEFTYEANKYERNDTDNYSSNTCNSSIHKIDDSTIMETSNDRYKINVLDVGQANTIIINRVINKLEEPFILYDCGLPILNANKYVSKITSLKTPEFLILSHFDLDHIKGLIKNRSLYNCKWIVPSIKKKDKKLIYLSKTAQMILNIKYKLGDLYFVDNSFEYNKYINKSLSLPLDLSIYKGKTPTSKSPKSNNALGLIIKIGNNSGTLLLTGDVFISVISRMNFKCTDLKILQMPHHGCKITTKEENAIRNLLGGMQGDRCVISANSKQNKYGHPNPNTINFLKNVFKDIAVTENSGDIQFHF